MQGSLDSTSRHKRAPISLVVIMLAIAAMLMALCATQSSRTGFESGDIAFDDAGIVLGASVRADPNDPRAATRNRLREGSEGTYIDDILLARDSSLARWKPRQKPLRVWIQPSAEIENFTPEHPVSVREAFMQWDSVGLSDLRFALVEDSARAEVHVTWIDRFKDPISGRTRWTRNQSWWITDASILLAVHHHTGERLDQSATRAMALHEIGHLIGLDHTADVSSVMAPRVRVRALSDADQATARLIYTLPAGAIR